MAIRLKQPIVWILLGFLCCILVGGIAAIIYYKERPKQLRLPEPIYIGHEVLSSKYPLIICQSITTNDHLMLLVISDRQRGQKERECKFLKFDKTGKLLLAKTWKIEGLFRYCAPLPDDGAVLCFSEMNHAKVMALDKDGNERWKWEANPWSGNRIEAFNTTEQGETLFLLNTLESDEVAPSQDLVCLDLKGQEKWRKNVNHLTPPYRIRTQNGIALFGGGKNRSPGLSFEWSEGVDSSFTFYQLPKYKNQVWDIALDSAQKKSFYITSYIDEDTFYLQHIDFRNEKMPQVRTLFKEGVYQYSLTPYGPLSRCPMALEGLPHGGVALLDGNFTTRFRWIDQHGKVRIQAESELLLKNILKSQRVLIPEGLFYHPKTQKIHIVGLAHIHPSKKEVELAYWWIQFNLNELLSEKDQKMP